MEQNAYAYSAHLGDDFDFSVEMDGPSADVQALQSQVYGERYGGVPEDGRDGEAAYLVARDRNGTVATSVRILTADHRPFSFDSVVDVSSIASIGPRPAEIGRWCVGNDYRSVARARGLHFGMLKFAYLFAVDRSITDYLICVYADMERFYRFLFFEDVGIRIEHPHWGEVGMLALSLHRFEDRLRQRGDSLARFVFAEAGPNFRLSS